LPIFSHPCPGRRQVSVGKIYNGVRMSRLLRNLWAMPSLIGMIVFSISSAQQPDNPTFHIGGMPYYSEPQATLRDLAIQKGKSRENTFCVIGYKFPDGSTQAWVYWREGKAIILWEPLLEGRANLARSRRYLRIPQDVVPNETAVGGSNYLVTRQWVNNLIEKCNEKGETFTVKR
jgi:hypothetical protein